MQELVHPVALPPGAAGSWCLVRARADGGRWWAQLQVSDRAREQVVRQVFLGPMRRGTRTTLMHMPAEAEALTCRFITEASVPVDVRITVLSRAGVALRLLLGGWRRLGPALRGDRLGAIGRARAALGQAPARRGEAPPYEVWLALYEDRSVAGAAAAAVDLQVVVVGAEPAAVATSLASAPPGTIVMSDTAGWSMPHAEWVVLLGAGEVLAPHALARFAEAIARSPQAAFVCADVDETDAAGRRRKPMFKPQPGPLFVQSGLATAGACAFRRGCFTAGGVWDRLPADADVARLRLAQHCAATLPLAAMLRIPAILTHLRALPVPRRVSLAWVADAPMPSVSIIMPSACRSPHVLRCLRALIAAADYPNLEILLAVSRIDTTDRRQAACVAQAAALPGVRVLDLALPAFNYAQVNNLAAGEASGEFLLLLNDDVLPVTKDFISAMIRHAVSPGVGVVGALLLYGNNWIQHAGVIMGLAGLCEHAYRLAEAGQEPFAAVDREVSAVTGACLLVRARLFKDIGGFDEAFAVALNDVDLCLRIRATGASIVYAAGAVLHHYESLSLGRHYQGKRSSLEALEVGRLRERWAAVIADDPCYNPQASLEPGREWQPGFPPRLA